MQIFSARETNPNGREVGMRMGLLSKEMIALPPQSDNHEKLTIPGPLKRNRWGDMRRNLSRTSRTCTTHNQIGNEKVGHLQEEINVTREKVATYDCQLQLFLI